MRSFRAIPGKPYRAGIHPALTSLADECCGTLARLIAYVGVLALLAIAGIHFWDQLPIGETSEPPKAVWSVASRSHPAFAVSQFDLAGKTETYEIFRHPEGGRKDVFRWSAQDEKPVAELELYRPGGEFGQSGPAVAEIAARMDPEGTRELETAGVIDSKFGSVTLLRLTGNAANTPSCLGFMKRLDEPDLRISGWSCQGDTWPARRAAIGCILNRLILLTAGNEPKMAELFARAELKRGRCAPSVPSATSADWVTGAENPVLRSSF
ncbi:MAG: hypothetical protein E7813_17900 [Bradyrhizobium sp.]|uniref:hypothetical protein n=1 Tax=Bradyrhizobium sp. TaxID=376 RepID=UPI0012043DDE|nr:hypothetical protein [Bradyrhizobium sp.]THD63466.1 MAG: hypothetical protein E7813_17900 [Bradyrhizobium sp.]